jgi:MscS family membrane protein
MLDINAMTISTPPCPTSAAQAANRNKVFISAPKRCATPIHSAACEAVPFLRISRAYATRLRRTTLAGGVKGLIPLMLAVCVSWSALEAQSLSNVLKRSSPAQATAATAIDSLGRDTPSGTVVGFLQAAQAGNYKVAADYLQMSAARRQSQGPELATKLKVVMDRAFVGSLRHLSTRPEGNPEGGSDDQQTIGTFSSGETDVPVVLVRVTDPNNGKILIFSADTLSKVPELYDNLQSHRIEKELPQSLVQTVILGLPLWQWLALLAALPVAAGIGWFIVVLLNVPRRLWLRLKKRPDLQSYRRISLPLFVVFAGIVHRAIAAYLGLPLLPRLYYFRTIVVLITVGFFWFVLRATAITMQRLRAHAVSAGRAGTDTLLLLGERLVKALVFIIAILAILSTMGFNLTTVLAGLGIGGIAIAFAAQKTLENLFGGISVLGDEVIRVGDFCRFGNSLGTVEDISLRSTRIRTVDRTQLSIPNGALAAMNIENFNRRDKILFNPMLLIRYDTSPDQLRYVLAELRRMLYAHPKIEHDSARVRLASLDNSAWNLEVFTYVLTYDYGEFTAVREDLLLRTAEIVEKSGTGFAYPTRTLYVARERGLDPRQVEKVEGQVHAWRDGQQLPFPDFSSSERQAIRGSIEYPEAGSASRSNSR